MQIPMKHMKRPIVLKFQKSFHRVDIIFVLLVRTLMLNVNRGLFYTYILNKLEHLRQVVRNKSEFFRCVYLGRGGVSSPPNHQAGESPPVGCPLLLIQYIRSYPPYLEAVSSTRNLRKRHAVVTRDPLNKENEVGGACGTHGKGEKRVQGFSGKARGKETT
jgi:hypothetical protein